jgi:hypothetical protein
MGCCTADNVNSLYSYPGFVDVEGALELIPPGWESIPGFLKRFKNVAMIPKSYMHNIS